jgi:hypothetical protein
MLESGEDDIRGNVWAIDCDLDDLPYEDRKHIAARLFQHEYVCEGVANEDGGVEPSVTCGQPNLICVDGADVDSFLEAVRRDQEEVEDYLAQNAVCRSKPKE